MKTLSFTRSSSRGFTLVELLTVLSIMAVVTGIVIMSIPGMKNSQDVNRAAVEIQGVLESARTQAMAGNTYTWVGFFEENASTPGTAGTGQLVVSLVSSNDGTQLFSNSSLPASIPAGSLTQVKQLLKIPNVHLDILTSAQAPRSSVPDKPYQMGDTTFANTPYFNYPLGGSKYKFTKIIQFNPQGDATRLGDTPTPLMEIGLRPTHGSTADVNPKNVAAVQISGIAGNVTVYRP